MEVLSTERLLLREMTSADIPALAEILQDAQTMTAYEGAFTARETQLWLEKNLRRYVNSGYGLWAVILRETGKMIGQCGLTEQEVDSGSPVLEIGYLFNRRFWHHGYATEAAVACREYAFAALHAQEVYSIIRDTNIASQNVALRNGMHVVGHFIKHYRGADLPHLLYCITRAERAALLPCKNTPAAHK